MSLEQVDFIEKKIQLNRKITKRVVLSSVLFSLLLMVFPVVKYENYEILHPKIFIVPLILVSLAGIALYFLFPVIFRDELKDLEAFYELYHYFDVFFSFLFSCILFCITLITFFFFLHYHIGNPKAGWILGIQITFNMSFMTLVFLTLFVYFDASGFLISLKQFMSNWTLKDLFIMISGYLFLLLLLIPIISPFLN